MNKNEFIKGVLNAVTPPKHFLLFGAEPYQVEFYAKELLKRVPNENLLKLYFDEYDFAVAKEHLAQSSLFAASNTLYIKSDSRISAKELKELISLAQKDANTMIVELQADIKAKDEYLRHLNGNFARFFAPNSPAEAISILAHHAQILGLNISHDALRKIYELQNESLYLSASELNKLASVATQISDASVSALVYGLNGITFDMFFNKILMRQPIREDFFIFSSEANFSEVMFIKMLYQAFWRLFRVHVAVRTTGRFEASKILGYQPPERVISALQQSAMRLKTDAYRRIFIYLNEVEFELMTSVKEQKELYLLSSILRVQDLVAA